MKKILAFLLSTILVLSMAACGSSMPAEDTEHTDENVQTPSQIINDTDTSAVLDTSNMFTSRDKEIGYDESSVTKLTLANETVTIAKEGIYLLSGEISNGQIIVAVGDTEKVQLILDGANISSNNSAPIYVKSANKVFVTLAAGSKNTLSVIGEYSDKSENNVDGAVFSKSDITFNGNGELTVNAIYGHGIVGKDNLIFTSGSYTIVAERHGISANDSVRISDGTFHITSGKDGIQVENTEDIEKGFFYMANGSLTVKANGDAISASGVMKIEDGQLNLTTGKGAESVTLQSDAMGGGMRPNMQQQTTANEEESVSQKGLKSDSGITVNNGVFVIDTVDDGLHAAGNIQVTDGTFTIKSGDDGVHSDQAVIIENGSLDIPYCYEGIEGLSVTINGGTFDIVSSDDGLNAAGGTDSSGFGGRGGSPFESTDGAFITINSGDINIVSDGDSIDSNGALTINGGTLNLTCNGNGNTTIDASGIYSNNGGNITTNDGSESGNHMGGGRPTGAGGRPNKGNRPENTKDMQPPSSDSNQPPALPQKENP